MSEINGLSGEENEMQFMQDNASGYAAKKTVAFIESLAIIQIVWPLYSPDINPIEILWKYMKLYLKKNTALISFGITII